MLTCLRQILFGTLVLLFSFQFQAIAQENSPLGTRVAELGEFGEVVTMGEEGPTLLLLTCLSCRWRQFDSFMERNKDKYRMHAITWPGMGGTPVPDLPIMASAATPWHDNAIETVLKYIDENNLTDIYIMGSSFGGAMAMYIANERPELVKGVINLDGTLFVPYENLSEDRFEAANGMRERFIEPMRYDQDAWQKLNNATIDDPQRKMLYHGWFMSTPRNVMNAYFFEFYMAFPRRNQQLEGMKVPLLDIRAIRPWWTDQAERRQKIEDALATADLPEGYNLVFMYGSGHHVVEYQPEALDEMVATFISGETVEDFHPTIADEE